MALALEDLLGFTSTGSALCRRTPGTPRSCRRPRSRHAPETAADLKEGKSEVVSEQGQLIKVSKDKQGVIMRDELTKQWTDWVDYWAIDFDYESRTEIVEVSKNLGVEGQLLGTCPVQILAAP